MKKLNQKTLVMALGLIGFSMMSATLIKENSNLKTISEAWGAPASADALKNPVKGDENATSRGKKTYDQMCAICHGAKGKGDGMAGAALNPVPSNFTSEKIQAQSDGAIYWKMTEGKPPMAAYKDILKEVQRWELVNYIRTMKKK